MGRQKKPRYCCEFTGFNLFKPAGIPLSEVEIVEVALDELEAMRLCDFEGYDQEQAAAEMGISRGTIQRILYSGRRKLIDTVMHGKAFAVQESEHIVIRRPRRHGSGRRMRRGRAR